MSRHINVHAIGIAQGSYLSDSVIISALETIVALELPSGWDNTLLSFQGGSSQTGSGFVYQGNIPYTVSGLAGSYISIDPSVFLGVRSLRVWCGNTQSGIAQSATRTLHVITAEL